MHKNCLHLNLQRVEHSSFVKEHFYWFASTEISRVLNVGRSFLSAIPIYGIFLFFRYKLLQFISHCPKLELSDFFFYFNNLKSLEYLVLAYKTYDIMVNV